MKAEHGADRALVKRRLMFAGAMMLVVAAVAAAVLAVPARAAFAADDYALTEVNIVAEAQTDAQLHATEVRTFELGSSTEYISWLAFDPLPSNARLEISSMRIGYLDEYGALIEDNLVQLDRYVLQETWVTGAGPGFSCYSYDKSGNYIYLFVPKAEQSSSKLVVEFDYSVVNGVQLFKDAAEIDWKYVNESWNVPTENITMQISLPVPSNTTVENGKNLYVWGHGPEGSQMSDPADGTVAYKVEHVNVDQYAEAHILLPVNWFARASDPLASANSDTLHWDWVVKSEKEWSDASRIRAIQADAANIIAGVVCLILIIGAGVVCFVKGRGRKASGQYGIELKAFMLHPALFGQLARWGVDDDADLVATIERLAYRGAIRASVRDGADAVSAGRDGEHAAQEGTRDAIVLERMPFAEEKLVKDPLDKQALDMLFEIFAQGGMRVSLDDVVAFAKAQPQSFVDAFSDWEEAVREQVRCADLFDAHTQRWARVLRWTAVIMALFGVVSYIVGGDAVMAAMFIVSALVVGVFSYYTKRASQQGVDLQEYQSWMQKRLATIGEAKPTPCADDLPILARIAYLLGVGDDALDSLCEAQSEAFKSEGSNVAWWMWYAPYKRAGKDYPPVAEQLESVIDEGFEASQQTIRETDVEARALDAAIEKLRRRRS